MNTADGNSLVAFFYYRIVASTNTCYYSENQLFVQRSQYIRTKNHKLDGEGRKRSVWWHAFLIETGDIELGDTNHD